MALLHDKTHGRRRLGENDDTVSRLQRGYGNEKISLTEFADGKIGSPFQDENRHLNGDLCFATSKVIQSSETDDERLNDRPLTWSKHGERFYSLFGRGRA